MCTKFSRNMKYFVLALVLCSGFLSENGLSEKLKSQETSLDEKNFNLDNETYNQENHVLEDRLPNIAACKCDNGQCVMEDGEVVCKCLPGFGNYTSNRCKECNCGPDTNCLYTKMYASDSKVCLCKPGYGDKKGMCEDCECGPDSNCTWTRENVFQINKVCHCKPGYLEENGKCVATPCSSNPCKNGGRCIHSGQSFTCECVKPYSGQTCETSPCSSNPCRNGGECKTEGNSFVCDCPDIFVGATCQHECDCKNGKCLVTSDNDLLCECLPEYSKKLDVCEACNCGTGANCTWEGGWFGEIKYCLCPDGSKLEEKHCEVIKTSTLGTTDSSTLMTTILPSTVSDCYCGENSKSCHFDSKGDKECNCSYGYSENRGHCDECNCGPYGSCTFKYGQKQCDCMSFAIEKQGVCVVMETTSSEDTTAVTSTILISTAQECNCGPYGYCSFEHGQKQCDCVSFAIEKHGVCVVMETTSSEDATVVTSTILTSSTQECNCGPYGYCSFEHGQKQCDCMSFAIEKHGVCVVIETTTSEETTIMTSTILTSTVRECNCGPHGYCSFEQGQKQCDCMSFAIEKHGVCVVMETTSSEDTTAVTSTILTPTAEDLRTTSSGVTTDSIEFSTIGSSTVQDCDCGPFSYSCSLDSAVKKVCNCFMGYSQLGESCAECSCGPYGTCSFEYGQKKCNCRYFATEMNGVCVVMETTASEDITVVTSTILPSTAQECNCGPYGTCSFEYGRKKCDCGSFAVETNGVCVDICSEDKCVHGKCERIGKSFKCRCNEGFIGDRCEEKIQIKSNKQDLWKIVLVSITFAIFILVSGVLCSMTRMLNKLSKLSK